MFDLTKDLAKYKGIPPYASETFGVYQPMLGWQSRLTKRWIERGGQLIDPRTRRILNGRIEPGPKDSLGPHPLEFEVTPLEPGRGKSPYLVHLTKDLQSELLLVVLAKVQTFVAASGGNLPTGTEWTTIIDINNLVDATSGDLKIVSDRIRTRLFNDLVGAAGPTGFSDADVAGAKLTHLALMQHESQIATFLLHYAEGQGGANPDDLQKLFSVQTAAPLADLLSPSDPLSAIDPNDRSGSLSPVGFVHLFRQYFFNLGTFLGEPVEHVWLAPGTKIELVEVSTRRTLLERQIEEGSQVTSKSERASSLHDELSDSVKDENDNSTKLGVTTTNTVSFPVYQGTVTANFGIESTRKQARETSHKQVRDQTEKISNEITRSYKSVFKTVTETTDVRTRKHVIKNNTQELLNYELRRKMRRVGVQMQDVGERLCWQVFVDDPGSQLGLSELVHFAESPDLTNLKAPETIPVPASIAHKVVVPIPFAPILDYTNNRAMYEYAYLEQQDGLYKGKHLSIIKGDEDDDDSQTIMGPFHFKFDPPKANYALTKDIRVVGVQGNKIALVKELTPNLTDGTFDVVMQRVNFGGENVINLDVEIVFAPSAAAMADYEALKKAAGAKYEEDRQAALQKSFKESVRTRIRDASSIRSRPSWDLREEERTVVYRKLLERLMLDTWKLPDTPETRRLSHVRAEVVRSIFDIDAMLYFVAPEWWVPRRRGGRLNLDVKVADTQFSLTTDDSVLWGGERRDSNYRITEESTPAKLGSSLGWLLQLDGDNLRNAFLNAPWVKAVMPIRPGREQAALNWLRAIEGHEHDGWDTPYLGTAAEDAEFAGRTVGEVLDVIAERLAAENDKIEHTLEADKVFEHGFDPLAGGFDAGLDASQVFSQWITILPTDQIVAAEYVATELFEP